MLEAVQDMKAMVDERFVGFSPNTTRVKPVHLANGFHRAVAGSTADTSLLFRFVFSQKATGEIPRGHGIEEVYQELASRELIDKDSVRAGDLPRFRALLKKVVNSDEAVYTSGMESYSAGHEAFLSRDRIAQDAGEFVAEWLALVDSPLHTRVKQDLSSESDIITTLCRPLLGRERRTYVTPESTVRVIKNLQSMDEANLAMSRLAHAAELLAVHLDNQLEHQPNKLMRLRLAVLYVCFFAFRHLANLEYYYLDRGKVIPFLLDMSMEGSSSDPVRMASQTSYTIISQSLSRFYGWAFAQLMQEHGYGAADIVAAGVVPTYKAQKTNEIMWANLMERLSDEADPLLKVGQVAYDLIAVEAEASPVDFMGNLGTRMGLLWPPNRSSKRFVVNQDLLEVLLLGCLGPNETVGIEELQDRLWTSYGIVIGGRPEDEEILLNSGIYHADSAALEANRAKFVERLKSLDFARLFADGVLQVSMGV